MQGAAVYYGFLDAAPYSCSQARLQQACKGSGGGKPGRAGGLVANLEVVSGFRYVFYLDIESCL
jgi:hypothetical protein